MVSFGILQFQKQNTQTPSSIQTLNIVIFGGTIFLQLTEKYNNIL